VTFTSVPGLIRRINLRKVAIFFFSIALFILALELMKTGARGLAPFIKETLSVTNPINGLGFGWLFAYGVMSGSPVAAAALTFFDAHVIDQTTAFAMITGSRLGASLIVLVLGMIYVLRGHERSASLTTGLLSLIVTATVYVPALPVGYALLQSGILTATNLNAETEMVSFIDVIYGPPVQLAASILPGWAMFLLGLGVIITTFNLFDKALPDLKLEGSAFDAIPRLLYRPIVTFALGFVITMLTMSVSVSLGLLVPLSVRGYIRRENLIPYIMGCNISTFIDTLVAGLLLRNASAAGIVLAEMISIIIISTIILLFFFSTYERTILRFVTWLGASQPRLMVFFVLLFVIPLILLVVR
jgi:solute carrier family 34 (sodium-dependent phosphate cotransporter)